MTRRQIACFTVFRLHNTLICDVTVRGIYPIATRIACDDGPAAIYAAEPLTNIHSAHIVM